VESWTSSYARSSDFMGTKNPVVIYNYDISHEEALTNHVPAVAVIPGGQALFNYTGCKRCVGG